MFFKFLVGFAALVFLVLFWPVTLGVIGAAGSIALLVAHSVAQQASSLELGLIAFAVVMFVWMKYTAGRNRAGLAGLRAVRRAMENPSQSSRHRV